MAIKSKVKERLPSRRSIEECNALVTQYVRLIDWCIYHRMNVDPRSPEVDELRQIGSFGLIRSAELFDESKGCKFLTYAVRYICWKICAYWDSRQAKKHARLRKRQRRLPNELLDGENCECLCRRWSFDDELEKKVNLKDAVDKLKSHLDKRSRAIIELRFGRDMTLEQIAQEYGITRERARQIICRAITKLRDIIAGNSEKRNLFCSLGFSGLEPKFTTARERASQEQIRSGNEYVSPFSGMKPVTVEKSSSIMASQVCVDADAVRLRLQQQQQQQLLQEQRDRQKATLHARMIEAFNRLITKRFDGTTAWVGIREVVALIRPLVPLCSDDDIIAACNFHDVEAVYRESGWSLRFNLGYGEELTIGSVIGFKPRW